MEGKVYAVLLRTCYEDYDWNTEDTAVLLGVCSTIELARMMGKNELLENFCYDEDLDIFYYGQTEAWICIWECDIDQKLDLTKPPIETIPKQYE